MKTITTENGLELEFPSEAAYTDAEEWYNTQAHNKAGIIDFCRGQGVELMDGDELIADWADIAMHTYAVALYGHAA